MQRLTMTIAEASELIGPDRVRDVCFREFERAFPEIGDSVAEAVIQHYWHRQIGYETFDLFAWGCRNTLREKADTIRAVLGSREFVGRAAAASAGSLADRGTKTIANTHSTGRSTERSGADVTGDAATKNYTYPLAEAAANADFMSAQVRQENTSRTVSTGGSESDAENTGVTDARETGTIMSFAAGAGRAQAEYLVLIRTVVEVVIDILAPHFLGIWDISETPYLNFWRGWV